MDGQREREFQSVAKLRLNMLFAGRSEGTHRACVLLGIVATCRALGLSALRFTPLPGVTSARALSHCLAGRGRSESQGELRPTRKPNGRRSVDCVGLCHEPTLSFGRETVFVDEPYRVVGDLMRIRPHALLSTPGPRVVIVHLQAGRAARRTRSRDKELELALAADSKWF